MMSFRQQRPPRSADGYELGFMMYEEAQSQSPCAVVETEFCSVFDIYNKPHIVNKPLLRRS